MTTTTAGMMRLMHRIAPQYLAEEWDNCGLQAGRPDQPVNRVWVALDPSLAVVTEACAGGADMLITHHPLLMGRIKTLDFNRMPGRAVQMAAENGLSIFSAHTNLDSAEGGLNDLCAQRIGLFRTAVLTASKPDGFVKLAVFVPVEHEESIMAALEKTPAGTFGEYSACSFAVRGTGRFKPSAHASPFIGKAGEVSRVDEVRVETIVDSRDVHAVVDSLKAAHPYETMAYDIFPLSGSVGRSQGLGRIGALEVSVPLADFAESVKAGFGVESVRVAGDPGMMVRTVALCSGSGSGLMGDFLSSSADVYVSGDLKYHDGMAATDAGRALVDVGHFETECLVVDLLEDRLKTLAAEADMDVIIEGYKAEQNPYTRV
ncbi:MAG: Nif3-like dinuclear metal center hexameric protein [Thermodesulfobacteriota bacterium]|nr:Nif3-like dinuclear metal center hexameric protein [Thermodesulfobacteriota bacterium]